MFPILPALMTRSRLRLSFGTAENIVSPMSHSHAWYLSDNRGSLGLLDVVHVIPWPVCVLWSFSIFYPTWALKICAIYLSQCHIPNHCGNSFARYEFHYIGCRLMCQNATRRPGAGNEKECELFHTWIKRAFLGLCKKCDKVYPRTRAGVYIWRRLPNWVRFRSISVSDPDRTSHLVFTTVLGLYLFSWKF